MANYNSSHAGVTIDNAVTLVTGNKTKNYVLAAPASANGTATFRALTVDDMPDMSDLYGGTLSATYTETTPGSGVGDLAISFTTASDSDNEEF